MIGLILRAIVLHAAIILFACSPVVTNESLIKILNTYQDANNVKLEAINEKIDRIDSKTTIIEKKMRPKMKIGAKL